MPATAPASLRLFLALSGRFAHGRGRALVSALGIALGVALGFAVHLVNRAALAEFTAAARAVSGSADLELRGPRSGFDESLYMAAARSDGVAVASPVLETEAALADRPETLKLIGLDPFRAGLLQPALFGEAPALRFRLLDPDTVLLSAAAAGALGLGEGDRLALRVGEARRELEVAGVLPASSLRGRAALTDIATAQWRLERLGRLTRIDLRLAPGADREVVAARLAAIAPPGVQAASVEAGEEAASRLSRAYRVNLNMLALVALFTGGFLVFSTQALEVVRRRPEHALLRTLGLARRGITRLVLIEAAAIGAAGSLVGLALGALLAGAALAAFGGDLGAGMFRGLEPSIHVSPGAVLGFFAAGLAIALAGAWLPALAAARVPPAQALKAAGAEAVLTRPLPVWPGLALVTAGALAAPLPPLAGLPLAGYAAIACLLVGGILLLPALFRCSLARLPLPAEPVTALALSQLRASPGQATVSLAALVSSFALIVAMAIMVASFRASVDAWLGRVLPADLYFRVDQGGDTATLDEGFEAGLRALPQAARSELMRADRIMLDPGRPPVSLIARDLPRERVESVLPLIGERRLPAAGEPPPAWVSEAMVELYGYRVGGRITLPLAGRAVEFTVAGVWRDYARQHGAVFIERALWLSITGDHRTTDGGLWLAPGASAADAVAALRALPGGGRLEIADPGEIRSLSLGVFDRSFAVTYALEAVAILVGLFGLASSLGALVLARRREFGVLRHLGMTRRQIGRMLAVEGAVLAGLGTAAGLALGGAIGLVLIRVVNRQSFHWSMDLYLPFGLLAAAATALIMLAILTALVAGRGAMSDAPVRAVREDW